MKKFRGLRRYYQQLQTKTEDWSELNFVDPELATFDLWHTHFDWRGYGNTSFKKRKPHLDKLFRHFDLLAEQAKLLKTDYQIWATLLDYDSYSDALFLHMPNKNHQFPWIIPNLSTENNLTNPELVEYLNQLKGYKIVYGKVGEHFCVITKENVGIDLG